MERIQSALERARSKRIGAPSRKPTGSRVKKLARPDEVQDRWNALQSFEPNPKVLAKNRIHTLERGELSVPLDMLRTKVLQLMRDNGWKRLAITSPNSSCGKTTTSLNLAFGIARQLEHAPILIEMDLRRPNLASTLGMPKTDLQFSKVLEGEAPIASQLRRIGANLAVGANASPARHPSELLQSDTMKAALEEIEASYAPSLLIFDMPPMLVSDDMIGFADSVDCVLLVAAAESTTIKELDDCERELGERTNVLGVVLNKCRYMGKEYGYNYYG